MFPDNIYLIKESTDIDKVQWIVAELLLGDDAAGTFGIIGDSSIFSKSAAPAEFCLHNLGLI